LDGNPPKKERKNFAGRDRVGGSNTRLPKAAQGQRAKFFALPTYWHLKIDFLYNPISRI
jgi:hypothetical protein